MVEVFNKFPKSLIRIHRIKESLDKRTSKIIKEKLVIILIQQCKRRKEQKKNPPIKRTNLKEPAPVLEEKIQTFTKLKRLRK